MIEKSTCAENQDLSHYLWKMIFLSNSQEESSNVIDHWFRPSFIHLFVIMDYFTRISQFKEKLVLFCPGSDIVMVLSLHYRWYQSRWKNTWEIRSRYQKVFVAINLANQSGIWAHWKSREPWKYDILSSWIRKHYRIACEGCSSRQNTRLSEVLCLGLVRMIARTSLTTRLWMVGALWKLNLKGDWAVGTPQHDYLQQNTCTAD